MRSSALNRIFESAWTRSQLQQRYLAISTQALHQFQELLSHMVYPNARLRSSPDRLMRNELGQPGLWSMGISGDLPILSVLVADDRSLLLTKEVLLAHTYWRLQGFMADIVVVNQEAVSYDQALHSRLQRILEAHTLHTGVNVAGGVFLRDWNTMSQEQRNVLLAASRVVLHGARGRLGRQLAAIVNPLDNMQAAAKTSPPKSMRREPANLPFLELDYFNGLGGFSRDKQEYCIYMDGKLTTPKPWVNVIAGVGFGTVVGESGLGSTWAGSSQANRLTPWRNDPVSNTPSEAIYLRDEDTGEFWSPTAQPARTADAYRVRHRAGCSVFEHNHAGIEQLLSVFVPNAATQADPVKVCLLRLVNRSSSVRRLSVFSYVEWVLGTTREETQMHVRCSVDSTSGALTAQNPWSTTESNKIAFTAIYPRAQSWTADRSGFLGRNGSYSIPQALGRASLDKRLGAGLSACGALQTAVTLEPGATQSVVILLGQTADAAEMRLLLEKYSSSQQVEAALEQTQQQWRQVLSKIEVKTPIHSVNLLMNGWLNYQSLSCRFWGRSAFYQSGGAFGFRDQLQDCMSLVYMKPELVREHILVCASRQFIEGDVQHWWHPESGVGVRTKCSDDYLWLPYVTAHYVAVTGDTAILEETATFLAGAELEAGKLEHLEQSLAGLSSATLMEHCLLALEHSTAVGEHGLPLMGNGDWNDGMNLVGAEGKGESVWLAWFLIATLQRFAELLERLGNGERATELTSRAQRLRESVEAHCWDGEWYLRAFFDDGSPLGSKANAEARIDSIAQSWAVMADADPERTEKAIQSAIQHLVREDQGIVQLFTPPFDQSRPHPGYIMGYPPGLRENGGQYTHGSLWLAMACAMQGNAVEAVRLLQIMNPIERARDLKTAAKYGGEPYVVAADVYSAPGHEGQSGWTWYTGSASWMYRIWLENVLGFQLRGNKLYMRPQIPATWPGFTVNYQHLGVRYEIEVHQSKAGQTSRVQMDGTDCGDGVPLSAGTGVRRVDVFL
jgi:cyclic beta-1,2-glucan synthetase